MKKMSLTAAVASVALVMSSVALAAVTKQCTRAESQSTNGCRGTEMSDTLLGNNLSYEDFVALGGADTVKGFGGGDDVTAGYGDDTVFGGDGADELHGNDGDDLLYGDAGADDLYGDRGNDVLRGGDGGQYKPAEDRYYFSANVGWGRDTIVDAMPRASVPSTSNAVIVGSTTPGAAVTVYMGSSSARSEVRNAGGTETVNWSGNVVNILSLSSSADDEVYGNDSANSIYVKKGADQVRAAGGDDYVDVYELPWVDNAGSDTVDCGPGNDTVTHNADDTLLDCEVQKVRE